jgi:hypothetical protein
MKRYLPIIVLIKLAELVQFFTAWAVMLYAVKFTDVKYTGRLPRGFQWMETPDDPLPGGTYEPTVARIYDRFGFYWGSVYWLMRNRAYRLSRKWAYWPSALVWPNGSVHPNGYYEGNLRTGDDEGDQEGTVRFFAGDCWEFYKVKRLFGDFGYRIRFGWKLAPFFRTDFAQWPDEPEKTAWGMPVAHVSLRRIKSDKP